MIFENIEQRAGTTFRPLKLKPWNSADEMPSSWLKQGSVSVFRYTPEFVTDFGPTADLEPVERLHALIDLANNLGDHFPYNDRTAKCRVQTGKNAMMVALEIEPMDAGDDTDPVTIVWLDVDDEGLFLITSDVGDALGLIGELPDLGSPQELDRIVLGNG